MRIKGTRAAITYPLGRSSSLEVVGFAIPRPTSMTFVKLYGNMEAFAVSLVGMHPSDCSLNERMPQQPEKCRYLTVSRNLTYFMSLLSEWIEQTH